MEVFDVLKGEEKKILASRKLEEPAKQQKLASLKAVCQAAIDYLPDMNLSPEQMRSVYYKQIAKDYNPKYGDLQKEVAYQIWTEIEHEYMVYFPQDCAEYAKNYIFENGFENTLSFHLDYMNKNMERNMAADRQGVHHGKLTHEARFKRGFETQIDEIVLRVEQDKQDIWGAADQTYRNYWDRLNYELEQQREKGRTDKAMETGLLKKKRNKHVSPASIKEAVREMTERGFKQKDIAWKLGKSERWIREIQKELKENGA